jgi:hypothetical protein
MNASDVNGRFQRSRVLSIRMTELEFRQLHETLRNYGISRPTLSMRVRVLLSRDLHRSRRFKRSQRQFQSKALKHGEAK